MQKVGTPISNRNDTAPYSTVLAERFGGLFLRPQHITVTRRVSRITP